MFVRPPRILDRRPRADTGLDILGHEVRAEQASSLGHAGRKVEASLRALSDFTGDASERAALADAAAEAVYAYIVQREVIGLRNTAEVIRDFAVPREVMARLGATRR